MSWIQRLSETYDNCQELIGVETEDKRVPLLPVCHTTQMAHVEIVIDGNGSFRRAYIVPKKDARTIIPCTEKSIDRKHEAPHPLSDKLQYVAGDFSKYVKSKESYFESYQNLITQWCNSDYTDPKINAVLKYISKRNLIEDLINYQILYLGDDGFLLERKKGDKAENLPTIFKVSTSQQDAFIRWIVEIPGDPESKVWRNQNLWQQWILFQFSLMTNNSLCYVTGEQCYIAKLHPAKILSDGDSAKLISSNDTRGFTFCGRFAIADQAASIGFESSQKAHFALRWLFDRQGYRNGSLGIVAWATSGVQVPKPTDDPVDIIGIAPSEIHSETAQTAALKFKKRIAGYGKEIGNTTNIVVLAINSATTGRSAITYYQELEGSDYLQRIDSWHNTCSWLHRYKIKDRINPDTKKTEKIHVPFIGAPAPVEIAKAVYGKNIDDKLERHTISRILPCIIEGRPLPRDLMESAVRRASNRISMDPWEWEKTLSIACALFKKYHEKEKYDMSLDLNNTNRDYLYGRLLAIAETLERQALSAAGEKRETNAARLMQRFSDHPFTTWRTIELSLAPYKTRLGARSRKYQDLIDEIMASFKGDDFLNDSKLSGEFLLGYHCQREAFWSSITKSDKTAPDENQDQSKNQ